MLLKYKSYCKNWHKTQPLLQLFLYLQSRTFLIIVVFVEIVLNFTFHTVNIFVFKYGNLANGKSIKFCHSDAKMVGNVKTFKFKEFIDVLAKS